MVVLRKDIELPPYYPDTPKVREGMAWHYDNIAAMGKGKNRRFYAQLFAKFGLHDKSPVGIACDAC